MDLYMDFGLWIKIEKLDAEMDLRINTKKVSGL